MIENLTVFERVEAEFGSKQGQLICITGETGAGKTMLLQALQLISGAKADPALIGAAGSEAYVEAAFSGYCPQALAELHTDPEAELILARRLCVDGPARALCDGRGASASQLEEAAAELISLTGQHAARRLVSPAFQLRLLDDCGGLDDLVSATGEAYRAWQKAAEELAQLRAGMRDRQRRLEMLRYEQELFAAIDPTDDEQQQLEIERSRLRHAEMLAATAVALHQGLAADEGAALERIDVCEDQARKAADHDPRFAELADSLLDLRERLADVANTARSLRFEYESDPQRLEEVEQRLSQIGDLRRRFGGAEIADIRAQMAEAADEMATLEEGDAAIERLEAQEAAAKTAYEAKAKELRAARRKAAIHLRRAAERHLADLALPEAELEIKLEAAAPGPRGSDRVEFLLRANRGLEPAPLGKGASGGELSRVNLALVLAASDGGGSSTYLFDEVDAGIGGKTAHAVAAKLAALAETSQVIVITHLAQIAVRADAHFVVEKKNVGERTVTTLRKLEADAERQAEIARLVGADDASGEEVERLVKSGAAV